MRSWSTKEARIVLAWAGAQCSVDGDPTLKELTVGALARNLGRSSKAIMNFLRREIPPGKRPWSERPRWEYGNGDAGSACQRSPEAVRKFRKRRSAGSDLDTDPALSISQVARDLGVSRTFVYRLLDNGLLRRFRGGIAESSFIALLRNHPEAIPYRRLGRDQREWLVLNGYWDPAILVKAPSTKGWLK